MCTLALLTCYESAHLTLPRETAAVALILCCPLQEIWGFAATRVAPPVPISVCSITVCPNSGMAASVGDF